MESLGGMGRCRAPPGQHTQIAIPLHPTPTAAGGLQGQLTTWAVSHLLKAEIFGLHAPQLVQRLLRLSQLPQPGGAAEGRRGNVRSVAA